MPASASASDRAPDMKGRAALVFTCGLLPVVTIHFSYWLNIHAPDALAAAFQCNPYFEGCVSVSRAVRSGPGLYWFKLVMMPLAICLAIAWQFVTEWMAQCKPSMPGARRWTIRLGVGGAIALVFYVVFLGTDGEVYRWLRRYGVVFFFGFSALAQLLVARMVWEAFNALTRAWAALFVAVVACQWLIGVSSVFKRLIFSDPALVDRLENGAEWLMVVLMSLGLMMIGLLMGRARQETARSY